MKKRNGNACRFFAGLLSAALVFSLVFSGEAAVFAEGVSGRSKSLSLNQELSSDNGAGEEDPMEGTVIVMMEDGTIQTGGKLKKTLSAGEEAVKDITVEDVWTFDEEQKDSGKKSLRLKSTDDKDEQEDTVVALVSSDSMSADKLVKKLNKRKDVVLAEKNVRVHALSLTNDTYIDHQWSMQSKENAPNVEYEWSEKGVTGSEKIVAVVDTGVDHTHPDLKANMWVNTHKKLKGEHGFDFINGDPDPMDDNGHGTHCAGIIGAAGNNNEGISGVNQNIRIMALKCLDDEGSAWLSHEIAAYDYINKAIDLGEPVVAINNSWGGGMDSGIFAKLIDIVGQKGAATVCAAGNEGANNDDEPNYPAYINSPYLIDVAATGRDGELADYSNYGESVDIAAPGSEILSTVPYTSYNPTLYGDAQDSISTEFNSFSDDSNTFGVPDKIYLNGEECTESDGVFSGKDGQAIRVQKEDEGFSDGDTDSLSISFDGLKSDDIVGFEIPYTVEEDGKIKPSLSIMTRTKAPDNASLLFSSSLLFMVDLAEEEKPDFNTVADKLLAGFYIQGESRRWRHVEISGDEETKAGDRRKIFIAIYAAVDGDYAAAIDDIGLSRQDIEKEAFGKYDYMSGTSMATPFITGAVALKVAEKEKQLEEGQTLDIADVLNEMTAMTKEEPKLAIGPEGAFDFRLIPAVLPPRIGKVTVDTESDTIRISGSGLYPEQADFKVEVGETDETMEQAEIIPSDSAAGGKEILIRNKKWINNVENIRVTGAGGKVSRKKDLYLVSGKKEYAKRDDISAELSSEANGTDGKRLFTAWSDSREIRAQNMSDKSDSSHTIAVVDPSKLFDIQREENVKYGMLFGDSLVYTNGRLYTVVEYGAADEIESKEDDIWFDGAGGQKKISDEDSASNDNSGVDEFDGPYAIYSGEYRLISVSATADSEDENTVVDLGKLPDELEDLEDYTMAAYFGKIYFIGGSRGYGETKQFSDKVFVFDPKTKKWSEGPALPEQRAGGKAVQYGSELIYTLGEASQKDGGQAKETDVVLPDNLIFDGDSWRACSALDPVVKMYAVDTLDVGLTAKGLIYTGAPVRDLGDTFIYDAAENRYADTGYNFLDDPDEYGPQTVAVGSTLYGVSDGVTYTMPIESGLAKVKVTKKGKGKVKGAGSVLPGNDVKLTVKASKKYYIKSLKVNGKKIKLSKKATKKVYTIKKVTKAQKVQVVFARKSKKK